MGHQTEPLGTAETLDVQVDGDVATVSLNRPQVRNAFNPVMISELTQVFDELGGRTDVTAVLLRGNGKSFSAGADAGWMRSSLDLSQQENLADAQRMSAMFAAIDRTPHPVVCRVHGACLGGGMGLIAACDIVVAAKGTIFGFTEAKLGIIPAVISRFVLKRIGESWARALYLTAERFDAEVAAKVGLVHWVAEEDQLDDLVNEKLAELVSSAPTAVRAAKELIAQARPLGDEELRELTTEAIARIRTGSEGQEGLKAFLEKRPAAWIAEQS
jgi:methylglutaconyl-CoA hydratase